MPIAEKVKQPEVPNEVSSLVIPMQSHPLLLPNVSVAEILTGTVKPNPNTPPWHLGALDWRSVVIPVVSFEGLNNQPVDLVNGECRLAILNSFLGDPNLPFYGLRVSGIPKLVRVLQNELSTESEQTLPAEAMRVSIAGEKIVIPDLNYIERKILNKH